MSGNILGFMEFFVLLVLLILLPRDAAAGEKRIPQWKPLEGLRELEDHKLVLCLATVPWSGEARSFMRDVVQVVKRQNPEAAANLELRFVNTHRKSFGFGTRSLALYKFGQHFQYHGKLSAERVLDAVDHAWRHELFQHLHTAKDLDDFVDSTDRAFVLVDLCGWTTGSTVEDCRRDAPMFGKMEDLLYDTNSDSSSCKFQGDFSSSYRNLTEAASASFLTPRRSRFGVVTHARVLEDARLEIPSGRPWALLRRTEDVSRSWQVLYDPALLDEFLEDTGVIVDEVDRDTEIPRKRPSVFLFLCYKRELRNESIEALRVVRQVARHYRSVHPWQTAQDDSKLAPIVPENRIRAVLRSGRTVIFRRGDLGARIEGILKLLLEGRGDNEDLAVTIATDNETSQERPREVRDGKQATESSTESEENATSEGEFTVESDQNHDKDSPAEEISDVGAVQENEFEDEQGNVKPEEEQEDGQEEGFNFGFFDAAYPLQELLTGKSSIRPSVVVVFPERNARYVYPDNVPLSFTGLLKFLDGTISGDVQAAVKSAPAPSLPRDAVKPPFVNRDFHQINSVPRVTLETFLELVMGFRQDSNSSSPSTSASNSLVMFTLPWCGFCKRMELAVHEVYKYLLEPKRRDFKVPRFFQIDCSSNDCTSILANVLEEEEFPFILLFPGKEKHKVSVYRGAPTVNGILHFLQTYKTIAVRSSSTIRIQESDREDDNQKLRVDMGSVLVATDRLSATSPNFANSAVLLVSVTDEHIVGLVMNKDMRKEELFESDRLQNVDIGYGGPLYAQPKYLFTFTRRESMEGFGAVAYGLYAGGPSATEKVLELVSTSKVPASEFKFVAGHCGWSPPQLQEELAAGYWELTQYREDMFQWEEAKP